MNGEFLVKEKVCGVWVEKKYNNRADAFEHYRKSLFDEKEVYRWTDIGVYGWYLRIASSDKTAEIYAY